MESAEYSLDELLCQSLLLFRQYRFYDAPECGEKAFRILEEAHVWMGRTQECGVGKRSGKAGCFAPADSGVLLLLRENYLCLVLSFLLPHFHLLPASLYSSALQVLWKQLKKVEATFASTAEIRRKVS